MGLRITPKRWYRSYKLPGGQPRNSRWKPSSFLAVLPSLGNYFFFLFFTISYALRLVHLFTSASYRSVLLALSSFCRGIMPSSSYLSQAENSRIRGPSTKIIITIMIKAGTTCCVRGNIDRGPRYGKLQEKEGQRKEGEGEKGPSPAARELSSFSSSFTSGTFYHATFRWIVNHRYPRDWLGKSVRFERNNVRECQLIIHREPLIIPNADSPVCIM